jgi:hypothetical protein
MRACRLPNDEWDCRLTIDSVNRRLSIVAIVNPIANPSISNPSIGNPSISNPSIGNLSIGNPPIGSRQSAVGN